MTTATNNLNGTRQRTLVSLQRFIEHEPKLEPLLQRFAKMKHRAYTPQQAIEVWFYVAGDHCFGIHVDDALAPAIAKRLRRLKTWVIRWRIPVVRPAQATRSDAAWSLEEARELIELMVGASAMEGESEVDGEVNKGRDRPDELSMSHPDHEIESSEEPDDQLDDELIGMMVVDNELEEDGVVEEGDGGGGLGGESLG